MNWSYFRVATCGLAALSCFSLGLLAYLKRRDVKLNRFFALSNLFLGLWNIGDIIIAYGHLGLALFFDRLGYVWGTLIVPSFLFMSLEFSGYRLRRRVIKYGVTFPAVFLIAMAFTPHLIKEVKTFPNLEEVPGSLYPLFIVYFLSWVGYGVFCLFKGYQEATNTKRNQLKYVFFAFFLSFCAAVSYFISMVKPDAPPVFYALEALYTTVMAYAIVKHNVMEITLAFRYGLVYFLLLILLGAPFSVLAYWSKSPVLDGIITFFAPLSGYLLISKLKPGVMAAVDHLPPFKGRYDRYKDGFIGPRRDSIVNSPSLQQWAQNLLRSVRDILGVEQAAVLVHDSSYNQFVSLHSMGLPALEYSPVALENDGPVAGYLRSGDAFLVKDDLLLEVPDGQLKEINEEMGLFSAQVCVPLQAQERLAGLLMIGAKRHGDMFNALDVASMHKIKSGAEEALRSLLSALTQQQFASSWAHDLMHPFGPKGSFQFLVHAMNGKHGPLPEGLKKDLSLVLQEVGYVWGHMGALLNPLKHMNEERQKAVDQPLTPVFERTRAKYEQAAKDQGVRWIVSPPPETARVRCDAGNLEHRVIINLVDNAFRYVKPGGTVELGHRLENGSVIVYVRDTGPGVPADKMAKLFENRVRGDEKTGGKAGWGLYNAKTAVEANGGTIWVDNEAGRGASFCFKLPLALPPAWDQAKSHAA